MTASERLREIYARAVVYEPGSATEVWYVENDLADIAHVLPEIIAVVEAGQIAGEVHGCPQLTKSLAALDARLTADGNDKEEGN